MKRLKLYLETSVWNFYFADDAPEKKEITHSFYSKIKNGSYAIYISDVVLDEIDKAQEAKRTLLIDLIKVYSPLRLTLNEEISELAQKYLAERILPENKMEDALHAAAATVYEMDALISWNLKHLSNFKKMEMINGINLKEGYLKRLELITPMEVSDEEI